MSASKLHVDYKRCHSCEQVITIPFGSSNLTRMYNSEDTCVILMNVLAADETPLGQGSG